MKSFKKNIYCTATEDVVPCPNCTPNDVTIGTQIWTGCNANVSTYRDGTIIPEVTDPTAWASLTTGAWCWYNNDSTNGPTYGKLYNWYAVNNTANGGIAPVGYKVPTDAEWTVLTDFLGGNAIAGGKMKETGLCHWSNPNIDATNDSLFTGLPGGYRDYGGYYNNINNYGWWWSSTESSLGNAWYRRLNSGDATAHRGSGNATHGFSLRFIKDPVISCPDVTIGTQIWTGCNLDVTTYRNGDPIPQVTDPTAWVGLTTGAWCYYNNDSANGPVYGKLYNWYAVNDPRGLAPLGYHIPTDVEWTTLITSLGGTSIAGGALKEIGTTHWSSPNTGATNSAGFTMLGAGRRLSSFSLLNDFGYIWTQTPFDSVNAYTFVAAYNTSSGLIGVREKYAGLSVRLIKD